MQSTARYLPRASTSAGSSSSSSFARGALAPRRRGAHLAQRSRRVATHAVFTEDADSVAASSTPGADAWQPVLPKGTNAAYDAALAFLSAHTSALTTRADALRRELEALPADADAAARGAAQHAVDAALASARVNDPATRWRFERLVRAEQAGEGVEGAEALRADPVLRMLANERWRTEGGLDLLVSRRPVCPASPVSSGR